jgi:hypothetical protein
MRTEFRDARQQKIGRAEIDLSARPTRVALDDTGQEIFLNWDGAVDDAGQLRRCISCGCPDLFQEKIFPQVTGIVVVLAFAGAFAGMFGLVTNVPVLSVMVIVLLADVAILLFARKRLICYRCRTSYHNLAIARYHRRWDRTIAERYPAPDRMDGDTPERRGDDLAPAPARPAAGPTRLARSTPPLPAAGR